MTWYLMKAHPIGGFGGGGGHIDNTLPGDPTYPSQGLPGGPPSTPGWGGGWGSGNRPDNSLPWGPGHPSAGLPGSPGHPSTGFPPNLPGMPLPPDFTHPSGQPIVPGATPYGTGVATAPPAAVDAVNGAWVLVNVQGTLVWAWAQKPAPEAAPK